MKMSRRLPLLAVALAAMSFEAHAQLGPAPSWQLNQGAPNSCAVTGSGFSLPGVQINIPVGQASENGVLSAPGFPSLGTTQDTAFGPFVGPSSFFVFAAPYTLPPNTPLTLSVTTYNGTNYTGGVAHVSTITWDCTTGALVQTERNIPTLSHAGRLALILVMAGIAVSLLWRRGLVGS